MKQSTYPVKATREGLRFIFISEGKQGEIVKAIDYTKVNEKVYNLSFGDFEEENDLVNDLAVTNNRDTTKVLATVIRTIPEFFNNYPIK